MYDIKIGKISLTITHGHVWPCFASTMLFLLEKIKKN